MNCMFAPVDGSSRNQHYCIRCGHTISGKAFGRYFRNCAASRSSCENAGSSGSHLHLLLKHFGVSISKSCKCRARERLMNCMGDDWCEQNIETIVGWLREEARNRGLPFLSTVGRILVRKAIRNARREAERAKDTS